MKKSSTILLPTAIWEMIENSTLTKLEKAKAYSFLHTVLFKTLLQADREEYVPLHRDYLRINYGGNYLLWLSRLKDMNIVQVETIPVLNDAGEWIETYTVGKISKCYRINPQMLEGEFRTVEFIETRKNIRENNVMISDINYTEDILEDLQVLKINKPDMMAVMENAVNNITRESFLINEQVTRRAFEVHNKVSGYKGYSALHSGIVIAQRQGLSLLQDGEKFFVCDVDKYIRTKQEHKVKAYTYSIDCLVNGNFYANRAATNNRLHTNLTELPKDLFAVIKRDNNLTEIDLSNSQFALLGYMMQEDDFNTKDALVFRAQAGAGTLYEYMMEAFKMDRTQVKEMMMQVTFSKEKSASPEKTLFKTLFPSVSRYISNYKKANGDNQMAIALQTIESHVFVNTIYPQIKGKFGFCLTKHDSLIVRSKDREEIMDEIKVITDAVGFKGVFRLTK